MKKFIKGNWFKLVLILALFFISGCSSSNDYNCVEPKNPYLEGSEHYMGYEFGISLTESDGEIVVCGGSSFEFLDGCKEYVNQFIKYEVCLNQKTN